MIRTKTDVPTLAPCQPELTNEEAQRFIQWCNETDADEVMMMLRDWQTVLELPERCAFKHYHRIMTNVLNTRLGLNLSHYKPVNALSDKAITGL